jgi:sulfate adenylyltransferase subunit 2
VVGGRSLVVTGAGVVAGALVVVVAGAVGPPVVVPAVVVSGAVGPAVVVAPPVGPAVVGPVVVAAALDAPPVPAVVAVEVEPRSSAGAVSAPDAHADIISAPTITPARPSRTGKGRERRTPVPSAAPAPDGALAKLVGFLPGRTGSPDADGRSLEATREELVTTPAATLTHLDLLEAEAIHLLREVVAECERPCLLFSGGKDSTVLAELARRAFAPAPVPFPVLHVDTGHNFDEVLAFRDRAVARLGLRLLVASVPEAIAAGRVIEEPGGSRNRLQIPVLVEAIARHRFDAVFGGARRDEDKARAKERMVSVRDEFSQWEPRRQRPELWSLHNCRVGPGEHLRVFPLSNWNELDVWAYVQREGIELPSLYYAHRRIVVERDGMLVPIGPHVSARPDEEPFEATVRFRTVGDATCTAASASTAATVEAVIAETGAAIVSERGATRIDDRISDTGMEDRKREGYF